MIDCKIICQTAVLVLFGCALVSADSAKAKKYSVIYAFRSDPQDGNYPNGGPIIDSMGNLYGMTRKGGGQADCGTVYKISADGVETLLHVFGGEDNGDGCLPVGELVRDAQGDLFGTTSSGGNTSCSCGTVFKIGTDETESILYSFTDGGFPDAGLTLDEAGNLYGTTEVGGRDGDGTVFKLSATGQFTTLHAFRCCKDGEYPDAPVTLDKAGNLYGTTSFGGRFGGGTVFKIDKAGKETVLYAFSSGADGGQPISAVLLDKDRNLYGTTYSGGSGSCEFGCGVLFKVSPKGSETVLYSFQGGVDGGGPNGLLAVGNRGFFGTTQAGGGTGCSGLGCGTLFHFMDGTETVLYRFVKSANGLDPIGKLAIGSGNALYGATYATDPDCLGDGERLGCGVVFKFLR